MSVVARVSNVCLGFLVAFGCDATHSPQIQVVAATFGANCTPAPANATAPLAMTCNGLPHCCYTVNYKALGDPKPYCTKSYLAEWRCGDAAIRRLQVLESQQPPYTATVELACD